MQPLSSILLMKTTSMKRLLTLIVCIGAGMISFAQNTGEITGKVLESGTTKGVSFANVVVYSEQGEQVLFTETDFDGLYTCKPLDPAIYDIKVFSLGYDTVVMSGIEVLADGLVYQDFMLTNGVALDTFVYRQPLVSKQNPQEETKITGAQIRHQGGNDVADIVSKNVPKVIPVERTGGLSIGGSREDAVLYVVDGVRVIGSAYLPINSIKEINVITGGIPAAYGDFMGGVIEITTYSYSVY